MTDPNYTKHTTHTDALDTLGTIIGPDEKRDAIHLAVFPLQAGENLMRGWHVKLGEAGCALMRDSTSDDAAVGIVDPFLDQPVRAGEWFWLVVYPRQITSLRHVWEHPAFPPSGETEPPAAPETKDEAEAWLRQWLGDQGDNPGFDAVMAVIETGSWCPNPEERWDLSGEYGDGWGDGPSLHFRGTDAHGDIPDEFWDHVDVYLGRTVPADERATHFTCGC